MHTHDFSNHKSCGECGSLKYERYELISVSRRTHCIHTPICDACLPLYFNKNENWASVTLEGPPMPFLVIEVSV